METQKNTQHHIDSAFKAIDAIEKVPVSPFFKDKTMQLLFAENETKQEALTWFTPQWQLVVLVCIVVLNLMVFNTLDAKTYESKLSEFAKAYELNSDTEASLFN